MLARQIRQVADVAGRVSDDLGMLARLTRAWPPFLRHPITVAQADAWHRERLATRESWFLRVAEQQIYAVPHSPYLRLLRMAGCELGDLRALVRQDGVEGALAQLLRRGVYVTFDEFKGRRPAVRGSQRLTFVEHEFDNARAPLHYTVRTGGTGGRRSRVPRSLGFTLETGYATLSSLDAYDLLGVPQSFWMTGPVNYLLRNPKMAIPSDRWFYPLTPLPWWVRLGAFYLAGLARLAGHRLPLPTHADIQQPDTLVAWIVRQRQSAARVCLNVTVSAGVRIASAATRSGISLDGVTFLLFAEPYTEARRHTVEASGARAFINYGSQEVSTAATSCAIPTAADDVHVFDSRYAVVQRQRQLDDWGPPIDALVFTSLTDDSPKTLLNVETGDFADLERRDCDCKLGTLGLRTHLANIRSFEKLTGEGMTFARSNLTQIVESVLPARFGGTSVDYQVVEEERPGGLPRLVLRVSPAVGTLDEAAIRATFLEALAQEGALEQYMAAFWARANTVEVARETPHVTAVGKVLPFQVLRATATGQSHTR